MESKLDLLVRAINEEIKAQNLYNFLIEKMNNETAETIFGKIIKLEQLHEEKIRKLLAKEYPDYEFVPQPQDDFKFKDGLTLSAPEDYLNFAIEREKDAEAIYTQLAKTVEDLDTQEMLCMFAEDERNHQEVLQDETYRLSGLLTWFTQEELSGLMED